MTNFNQENGAERRNQCMCLFLRCNEGFNLLEDLTFWLLHFRDVQLEWYVDIER